MNKKTAHTADSFEFEFDILNKNNTVVSATECTGLMPTPPCDMSEADSYTDIYVVPKQVNYFKKKQKYEKK